MRRLLFFGLSCLALGSLNACSAPEPAPRLGGASATPAARELSVVWVGEREAEGPLLVLLHGYGAPGGDLVPLAHELRASVGDSLRVALPAAPLDLGRGRAWWNITDGPRPADRSDERPEGMADARRDLDALLARWRADGLSVPERTTLAGFSQGGMLAMEVGLNARHRLAGIASLSGGPVGADTWVARASRAPPIFLSHGRRDPLLAFEAAERLHTRFENAGAQTTWVPFDGPHTIPPEVVERLGGFLRRIAAE